MNPLVIRHGKTSPPSNASSDEALNMTWYELTDEIQYIPGTAVKGEVSYKAGFYDLPQGLQTHVFAPGGVDIRGKWMVGGNMPGEEREPAELGVDKPIDGLYIREEVDLRCNVFLANFVKRNLKKSHGTVVERLVKKAKEMEAENPQLRKLQSVNSASPESIVMRRNSLITTPVPYHQLYVPSSNFSRNPTPNSNTSQMSQQVCSCLGTRHHPACRYFIDIYQQPTDESMESPASDPPRSGQPSRTATWESPPTSAYSRSTHSMCFCTSGVHQQGCPSYPGLRFTARRSVSPPIEDSQQPPYQINWTMSNSRTPTPDEPRPPSNGGNSFRSQIYDRQMDSPESAYYRSIEAQKEWPNPELKPPPLMTRTAHGHAVLMELEGDMAQRYYEYQASKTTEPE